MAIPLLDLKREHLAIQPEVQAAWAACLGKMHLLNGENVAAFEHEIAAYVGTPQAIGVACGTDALILAMLALGIGHGDEVILQANAYVAALEAIHHCGARPVVVEVEADGFGPCVHAVREAMTSRTRAVIAVHLYGSPLQLDALQEVCANQRIALIEDGSHAHGARRGDRMVGSVGHAGCFSAGVVKNLGAYGDAGFITTGDAGLAERVRLLQAHGQQKKNHHVVYGLNSRLDELQAAVLRIKLRHLEARNARRREIAQHYRRRFAGLDITVLSEAPHEVHVYHQFVLRCARRHQLQAHLKAAGIESGIHYPTPLHRQPAWLQRYGESPALPRAERLANEVVSIPVFPDLTDAEVEQIGNAVVSFFS